MSLQMHDGNLNSSVPMPISSLLSILGRQAGSLLSAPVGETPVQKFSNLGKTGFDAAPLT